MNYAKLLWVDLEMTGLDPLEDRILEVAAIATDWELEELATYEATVQVDDEILTSRMEVSKDFWDTSPAARDALVSQNSTGRQARVVEEELIKFVEANFEPGTRVLLAGNSIHQDRKFVDNEWPQLAARLHYRMLDVSAWKIVFEGRYRKKFAKPEQHRAISDIRGSMMELKYYLKSVDKGLAR